MPAKNRIKTRYPGVYYILDSSSTTKNPEKIYYVRYRTKGKLVEEKAGRQFQDDMTPARAASMRTERMQGKQPSNKERREAKKTAENAEADKWTINRLWKTYKTGRKQSSSLDIDEYRYEKYLKPKYGKRESKELIPLDADRLRFRLSKKLSPQSVKHVLSLLERIINFGVKRQLCGPLPFQIQKPKVDNTKTEDLTPEQLTALLEAIDKDANLDAGNMMKLALFTGMRRGEMFKLEWTDVDFHRGFINIRDPKGGQSQRIPLNDATRNVLSSHPRADSPYVFPGKEGKERATINKAVNKIKEAAGLPKDFRPLHGLRHVYAYASMLASSGQVDMYTLQKLLTHKTPQMTQRYAHLRDETLRRASNLAGELVDQAVNGT
jgi:integrase